MTKATAIAPSNVALVKYMGRKDEVLRLPENASIAMNLDALLTTTTVEFGEQYASDSITINGESVDFEAERAIKHLDRIRSLAGIRHRAKVVSTTNFPIGTGLSSSSSGFAALTAAGTAALGLHLSPRELSMLARQGSGSACRSIPDGFVLWHDGHTSETSYAETIFPSDHWDIVDVVAIASTARKSVATSDAHVRVASGPYYQQRIARMPGKVDRCMSLLREKNFPAFGEFLEEEALDLHVIFMSAGIVYLTPESLLIIQSVRRWRTEGVQAYITVNTGQDVHVFCEGKDATRVTALLEEIPCVKRVVPCRPGRGTRLSEEHLF